MALLATGIAVLGCGSGGGGTQGAKPHARTPSVGGEARPNIVVVMSDDQDLASLAQAMPRTERLSHAGTTFDDFVVTTPSCCPSRAAFITGQYGHNNGIVANLPGYPDLRHNDNVLPVWLKRAGYRTAEFGKFMNGYESANTDGGARPAPGWDDWETLLPPYTYYDYSLTRNDASTHFGTRNRDYLTDALTRRAQRFIGANAGQSRPFFAWLNLYAPHLVSGPEARAGRCRGSAVPAPRDLHSFGPGDVPTPRSFGEKNVSDKPFFVRARPPMDRKRAAKFQLAHACRLASLVDVDRSLARIYRTLERTGQLDNTVLIFTSDNGWLEGEHRLEGKAVPYEEAVRVPLIVWAPRSLLGGASPPATVSEPAANIDLAPTLLKLASASPCPPHGRCRLMDGRSLVPLLEGHGDAWPQNRAILLESREGDFGICRFESVRPPGYVYTEYSRFLQDNAGACAPPSDRELYDLRADPSELRNLDGQQAGSRTRRIEARLAQRLDRLRTCEGIRGRNPAVAGHGRCE